MGLAHDRIVYFGMKYIEKGFVTKDEYEDLIRYFYEPYIAIGGDGTAERIMSLVKMLPLTTDRSQIVDAVEKGTEAVWRKLEEEGTDFERRQYPR